MTILPASDTWIGSEESVSIGNVSARDDQSEDEAEESTGA